MTTNTNNTPPIDQVRIGNVQASIWRNFDAQGKPRYSIIVDRHYKDANGKWQVTNSYSPDGLPVLAKVADLACDRVYELKQTDRSASTQAVNNAA